MVEIAKLGAEYYAMLDRLAKGEVDEKNNFFMKALTYDGSASGQEFIPTKYSAEIIRAVYEKSWHRRVFNTYVMDKLKERIPRFTKRWDATYLNSSITSTDPANQIPLESTASSTDYLELELKTLAVNLMIDNKFLTYNANPQVEQLLKEDLANALFEAEMNAIINGDTAGTHQDSDVTSATDPRKAFDGLRKVATTTVDAGNAAFSFTHLNKAIKALGRYARGQYENLALIVSPTAAQHVREWAEVVTMEKFGPNATVVKGEIGKVMNISVIETDFVREDLNASGVYDGTTTDRTEAILVNTKEVFLGVPRYVERTLQVKKWDDARFDRKQLIAIEDVTLGVRHPEAVVEIVNISTA